MSNERCFATLIYNCTITYNYKMSFTHCYIDGTVLFLGLHWKGSPFPTLSWNGMGLW